MELTNRIAGGSPTSLSAEVVSDAKVSYETHTTCLHVKAWLFHGSTGTGGGGCRDK